MSNYVSIANGWVVQFCLRLLSYFAFHPIVKLRPRQPLLGQTLGLESFSYYCTLRKSSQFAFTAIEILITILNSSTQYIILPLSSFCKTPPFLSRSDPASKISETHAAPIIYLRSSFFCIENQSFAEKLVGLHPAALWMGRETTGEADSIVSIAIELECGRPRMRTQISPHLPNCHLSDNRQSSPNPQVHPLPLLKINGLTLRSFLVNDCSSEQPPLRAFGHSELTPRTSSFAINRPQPGRILETKWNGSYFLGAKNLFCSGSVICRSCLVGCVLKVLFLG